MSDTWIVPGAPLANGAGWRIWYSRAVVADFAPKPLQISRAGQSVNFTADWNSLVPLPGLQRRMGILTVTLAQPEAGELYDVTIPEAEQDKPFQWMTMPAAIDENGVGFLFGSCFWRDNDKIGGYAAAVRELCRRGQPRPAFKILCGDQLYQDWPVDLTTRTPLEICAARYDN